jgi:hypothetical protein
VLLDGLPGCNVRADEFICSRFFKTLLFRLRLCELGGFIHVGVAEVGPDLDFKKMGCLLVAEVVLALILPMFLVSLKLILQW